MKYKLVIFDLDGTILDTLEDLKQALNHALAFYEYPTRTLDEVRRFVGNGIRKLIERAMPENALDTDIDRVFAEFNKYYALHCADYTKPYEGVVELIRKLRNNGIKTAVVSNKADYGVQELCDKYFNGLFDYAVGERVGVNRKPSPDAVYEVLSYLDIEKNEAVYVGDSEVDVKTAKNADMESIIVTWGFRDKEFLIEQGAVCIVNDCDGLEAMITD